MRSVALPHPIALVNDVHVSLSFIRLDVKSEIGSGLVGLGGFFTPSGVKFYTVRC